MAGKLTHLLFCKKQNYFLLFLLLSLLWKAAAMPLPYWHWFCEWTPSFVLCALCSSGLLNVGYLCFKGGCLWFANENSYMCPRTPILLQISCSLLKGCWHMLCKKKKKSFSVMNSLDLSLGLEARRRWKSGASTSSRNSRKKYHLAVNTSNGRVPIF